MHREEFELDSNPCIIMTVPFDSADVVDVVLVVMVVVSIVDSVAVVECGL